MATKCTWLFQLGTTNEAGRPARLGGWSESWYNAASFGPSLVNLFSVLGRARARLLPGSAQIVGMRFQDTDGLVSGASESVKIQFPGTAGADNDAPQLALKFAINADGAANKKIVILRGIPDSVVRFGEYSPDANYRSAFNQFCGALSNGWAWRGQTLNAIASALLSINAAGVFVTEDVTLIASNTMCKVLRARNSAGRQKGGRYKAVLVAGATGTLLNWNHGDCTGGRIRREIIMFPTVPLFGSDFPQPEVIVKKVGRPFSLYRGRKPVKSPG